MEICTWTHYKGDTVWNMPCGKCQGIKCRPKQKICHCIPDKCDKRIERVEIDEISPREKAFREMCADLKDPYRKKGTE